MLQLLILCVVFVCAASAKTEPGISEVELSRVSKEIVDAEAKRSNKNFGAYFILFSTRVHIFIRTHDPCWPIPKYGSMGKLLIKLLTPSLAKYAANNLLFNHPQLPS